MGGAWNSSGDDDFISGINVTPLVDVVLVLLIIFLMTAPVIYQSAIQVKLPKASTGETTEKYPFNFTLTKEGELLWDKDRIDWSVLHSRLISMGNNLADQTATISADQGTPHGIVIRLIDELRNAGLLKFALNVEAKSTLQN